MIPISAEKIAEIIDGELHADPSILMTSAPTFDSRNVEKGSLFLAIKGINVDGHDFALDAHAAGAALVLSIHKVEAPCIVVSDVEKALGMLATYVRSQLPDLIVIGVTGSQGKTTTKDLLTQVLEVVGETVSPKGSLNNDLGAPLTLLNCTLDTRFCVVEMGARHVGDIARLCKIVRPNIGVVLTVGSAHLGEFGSVEAIARAKSELITNLSPGGLAILGLYDSFTPAMADGMQIRKLFFGQSHDADIRATDIEIREGRAHFDLVTPDGREAVALRLVGGHQIPNALAVAAVCTGLGIPLDVIASGLSLAELHSRWRMEIIEQSNILFINDAYNANPESTCAALKSLALFAQERGGQAWAFLGKMHELGEDSDELHSQVGLFASELGIDHFICVAASEYAVKEEDFGVTQVHYFESKSKALSLAEFFSPGDVVLIKGSRAEKMEDLAQELIERWGERVGEHE